MYLFGACSLFVKKLPRFWPIQTGKGNIFFNRNGKFKFQIDLDRHGPRPLLDNRHLADPPILFHSTLPLKVVTNEKLIAHRAWSALPIGGGGHRCANILAHRCTLRHYYRRTDPPWANNISALKKNQPARSTLLVVWRHTSCTFHTPGGGKEYPLQFHTAGRCGGGKGYTLHSHTTSVKKFKRGAPNSSVRLTYFHTNRLLIELYK
jgi:hypothetical protein